MGSPGYAYIAVTILDINDNPPIFSPSNVFYRSI